MAIPESKQMKSAYRWSKQFYLELNRRDIAYLRFLLESHHNLAYISILDKYQAIAQITFTPEQEQEVLDFLRGVGEEIDIKIINTEPIMDNQAWPKQQRE